ncbi:hypothetical protein [Spirosoma sp. 209]|uniref:hypothetical protein n=1 Tax=Spirosoma sp. 209 TaxID=1955701 RepID=UPI00098D50B7|nr:hypothetical protein [Spirosoma sp. 209]
MRQVIRIGLLLLIGQTGWAGGVVDDSVKASARFEHLAQQVGLRDLRLKPAEYQVRIWINESLTYGDADELYVIDKKETGLFLSHYALQWRQNTIKKARRLVHKQVADTLVWQQLLADDLLTLPDQSLLKDNINPKPNPRDTTVRVSVHSDSGVTIRAKKTEPRAIMSDGVNYRFDIVSANTRRSYTYHCPVGYAGVKPRVVELQKVVSLLKRIFTLFDTPTSSLCAVDIPQTRVTV